MSLCSLLDTKGWWNACQTQQDRSQGKEWHRHNGKYASKALVLLHRESNLHNTWHIVCWGLGWYIRKLSKEAKFQICTVFHRVGYRVVYRATDDFEMLTFFDLIAAGFAETQMYLVPVLLSEKTQSLVTIVLEEMRSNMKITVHKNSEVVIFSNNNAQMIEHFHAVLFDGPDTLAPIISFPVLPNYTHCSTFQCVLHMKQSIFFPSGYLYRFAENSVLSSMTSLHKTESFKTWSVPRVGSQMSVLWVDRFETDLHSHIEVFPSNFSFSGADHPLCLHGGIAFISVDKNVSYQMENICLMKNNHLTFLKPVYSSHNTLLVVSFIYQTHGDFQGNLQISTTTCHLLKVSQCLRGLMTGIERTRDYMFLQKLSTGEFFSVEDEYFPVAFDSTGYNCTVAQIRVAHPNQQCLFPFSQYFPEIYFQHSQISIRKEIQLRKIQDITLRGQLMSVGSFHTTKRDGESSLIVEGTHFNHDKTRDANFTVYELDQKQIVSKDFPMSIYKKPSSNIFTVLEPPFTKNLYFTLRIFQETPIYPESLSLKFSAWGLFMWLDVSVRPARTHMLNSDTKDLPGVSGIASLSWNSPETSLVLNVNENDLKDGPVFLSVQVELQV